jgi:hypothetical protein
LWCGDTALRVAFPALFGIARVKDAYFADNLEFLGGFNQWNVSFTWEADDFASFFQVLLSVKVRRGSKNTMWWVSSKKGLFKVKSLFLEKCLAHSGSFGFKGCLFCVVHSSWQHLYPRQPWEAACYCDKQMLCVRKLKSLWTIFFSIATWLLLCRVLYLVVSGCFGLCSDGLSSCLLVGGPLEG